MTASVVGRASVYDVLRLAGYEPPNGHGFVNCPLHAERSASFHVCADGRGYRCFGCGAKGGVLDLVVALDVASDHASAARWLEQWLP
jgi:DNA primase